MEIVRIGQKKTVDFRRCTLGTHERHAPPSGESCYCAAGSSAKTGRVRTTISVFWGAKTSHSGAPAPVRDPSQKHRQNSGNTQNHENPPGTFFLTDLVSYQLNFQLNPTSLQMPSNQHIFTRGRPRLQPCTPALTPAVRVEPGQRDTVLQ